MELLYSSHFNSRFLFYIIITFLFFITFPFLLFSLLSISSFRVHLLSNLSFIAFHILLPYLLFIYFLSHLRFICFLSFLIFIFFLSCLLFIFLLSCLLFGRFLFVSTVSALGFLYFFLFCLPLEAGRCIPLTIYRTHRPATEGYIYKRFTFQRNKLGEKHWEPTR